MKCENKKCYANTPNGCSFNGTADDCDGFIPSDEKQAVESSAPELGSVSLLGKTIECQDTKHVGRIVEETETKIGIEWIWPVQLEGVDYREKALASKKQNELK